MIGTRLIDAAASSRGYIQDAGDVGGVAEGLFTRAMAIARDEIRRTDGLPNGKEVLKRFDDACRKLDAASIRRRNDSITEAGGGLLAGQLRAVISETLEEKYPAPSGLTLFPVDTSIALGARSFAVRRVFEAGEARVHRGGDSEIPRVSIAQAEMDFQVRHYITSAVWDVFEEISASYANLDYARQLTRIARAVIERFANEMIWFGDDSYQIFGVLNYPWLDKEISDLDWYGTPADSRTHLSALNGYVNRQYHASKLVMGPNRMVTSPRVRDWIMQTPMGTTTTINDRTIGEVFLAASSGRLQGGIQEAYELENILGAGVDGMLFYRDDPMGIVNVMPGGGIQALPMYSTDITRRQIFWMAHGGVMMREVGNNLLVFVTASA